VPEGKENYEMVRPPDGLLRLPNRLRRGSGLKIFLAPEEWKVERGHDDPLAGMAGLFRAAGIGIRQSMPEMVRVRVWMSLNDGDASGHRALDRGKP
jgi:hypothetical protein